MEADQTVDEPMKKMNTALLATTEGDWVSAVDSFRAILEADSDNYVVRFISDNVSIFGVWRIDPSSS